MIEPGVIRTGFGGALSVAEPLAVYADTPVGQLHRYLRTAGNVTAQAPGDPAKVAAAIIASAGTTPAPRRVALGSDAHTAIRAALTARLEEVDAGRELARSIDFAA
ncbi:hypothetical protein AB0L10_42265 [Streptomyces flaveolus]|uniref:hypothetical protein n=1 Tax=Streptomyces flaveolus TaxID=67297 RepID=UPI0034140010